MARKDTFEVEARVIASLPNAMFRVELPNGHQISAHLSEKMQLPANPILPEDRVVLKMSPYDFSKGQIAFRLK